MVKQILRRAYGPYISNFIQKQVGEVKSEASVANYIDNVIKTFWDEKGDLLKGGENFRTDTEKEDTKIKAKQAFVGGRLFSINAIKQIAGNSNTSQGLSRLFNMMQHRELNRNYFPNSQGIVFVWFEEYCSGFARWMININIWFTFIF